MILPFRLRITIRPVAARTLIALLTFALLSASPAFEPKAAAFQVREQAISDIVPDARVTYGALPNGLRYALMPNSAPDGAISMRLMVRAGSLNENAHERGLFHFIEHMAFNGSRLVPEGDMVKRLARLGIAFGADANATTGQTVTTYALDLPGSGDDTVFECLFLLRQIAGDLSFEPPAVERERGVLLAEMRQSDTLERRRRQQQFDFLIPGALAASRMPIGDAGVLAAASPDDLRRLYNRFYRPERSTLVVVGHFDPDAMEGTIAGLFADWKGVGEPGPDADAAYALEHREPAASVFVHPNGGDVISVYSLSPFHEFPDTAVGRTERTLLAVGLGAVNRRLASGANADNSSYRSARLFASDILESASYAGGSAAFAPGEWKRGLEALEQAWRRALTHGFTQSEIDQQKAVLRTAFANAALQETSRLTPALADNLASSLQDEQIFTSPSFNLALFDASAAGMTPATVLAAFRKWMALDTPLLFMSSSVDAPTTTELIAAWRKSEAVDVLPPEDRQADRFSYTDFGPPGIVVADRTIESFQTRAIVFENNVRLNLKKTSFRPGSVLVSLRIGEGAIALEDAPFGLASLMNAYSAGGLQAHSIEDLQAMLGDRSIQAGLSIYPDHFGGIYMTTPSDLELQLQVAAAYLVHPGYRAEAERKWREAMVLYWPRRDADARATFASRGARLLLSGDRRFGTDPNDGLINRSFTELKAYLDPILKDAPIEIALVGDFDDPAAIAAVGSTFGALPIRAPAPRLARSQRPATFIPPRASLLLEHKGEPTQGLLKFYWPVEIDPDRDVEAVRTLSLLASVMQLKLLELVREDLGASYAPLAGFSYSDIYPGLNYLYAEVEARPADHLSLRVAVRGIAAMLREGAITQDELHRARAPSLEQLAQHASSNGYWLSVISQLQSRPDLIQRFDLASVDTSIRAIRLDDLTGAALNWLDDANLREMEIVPARPESVD